MEFDQPLRTQIEACKKIVIITHYNPDGDAIGSALGLYHILTRLKKKPKVVIPNSWPDFLNWMPGSETMLDAELHPKKADSIIKTADLIFLLDFNSLSRIGSLGDAVKKSNARKVLIDHHLMPEPIAGLIYSDTTACSTCQMVFELSALWGPNAVNKDAANCLYTGIMTDTGSFRHRGTDARTHRIIASLIEAGADGPEIHRRVYDQYSANRMRLLGHCLHEKLTVLSDYNTAFITLSDEELKHFSFKKGDTEGIVNYPLSIAEVKLSVFMMQRGEQIKISFRSKGNFDVNQFARRYFNGGGHMNAAGAESDLTMDQTIMNLVDALKKNRKELAL